MNTYVVFALEEEKLDLYTAVAYNARQGVLVSAKSPERAALAVRGGLDAVSIMRFAVVEATLIDFEQIPGTETMPTDEGPHR